MGQRRLTKKMMIDQIVADTTHGRFKGDKRDGEAPPITIQNFSLESGRYGAKALRARLSRLSFDELAAEVLAAFDYVKAISQVGEYAEQIEREGVARELRQRQTELGRRPRLQPDILSAARHYRGQGMIAGEAWDALSKTPFATKDGNTVEIVGSKLARLEQRMRVTSRDGRQRKRPIGFSQWRQRYWPAAT